MNEYERAIDFEREYEEAHGWRSKKIVIIDAIEELIDRVNDLEWELKHLKKEMQRVSEEVFSDE